jgi:hypothetical protein
VVLFAVPPEETYSLPSELTVVVMATPLSSTVMVSFSRMMPLLDSPLEMMYGISSSPQVKINAPVPVSFKRKYSIAIEKVKSGMGGALGRVSLRNFQHAFFRDGTGIRLCARTMPGAAAVHVPARCSRGAEYYMPGNVLKRS